MKKIYYFLISFLLITHLSFAANPEVVPSCSCDVRNSAPYEMEYQEALSLASKQASADATSSFVVDFYWAQDVLLKSLSVRMGVSDILKSAMEEMANKLISWVKNNATFISDGVNKNVNKKIASAMSTMKPEVLGLGTYTFEKGKFQEGSWQGQDVNLEGDSGTGSDFLVTFEVDIGGGFIVEGEVTIKITLSGTAAVNAQKFSSLTKKRDGISTVLSGYVRGNCTCSAGVQFQGGIGVMNKASSTKNWSNKKQTNIILTPNEHEANCP